MLAERKAVLRGAFGSYYDAPGEPFLGQLWLTFAGAPVVVLTPGEYGEGFYLEEDLREGEAIESDPEVRDLAADAPFAAVVDTALQEAGVITGRSPTSRRTDDQWGFGCSSGRPTSGFCTSEMRSSSSIVDRLIGVSTS
jgi:hypothetical protein